MDPLSQGLLGAIAAQAVAKNEQMRNASFCGMFAGMAADLDIFISSQHDPLLAIEYHRHFSHALAFVPIGGLVCALVFWLFLRHRESFKAIFIFSTVGYLTHGFLDACTSYGTRLYWPLDDTRIAWDIISIIDPVFTLLILLPFVCLCAWKKRKIFAQIGLSLAFSYLSFGVYQHNKAYSELEKLATSRGHQIERYKLNVSIGNQILWRTIYQHNQHYYIDAIRISPFSNTNIYAGTNVAKLTIATAFPDLPIDSKQHQDILRFQHFSQGLVHQQDDGILVDTRYGMPPNSLKGLWGLKVAPNTPNKSADFVQLRDFSPDDKRIFWQMLTGDQ